MDSLMPWLAPAPGDFRAKLKEVTSTSTRELVGLAQTDLDVGQLARLSATIGVHRVALGKLGRLAPVRLGIVSSHNIDFIRDALPGVGLRHGLLLDCIAGDYGQVAQSIFNPQSPLADFVDVVLLALDARMLGLDRAQLAEGAADLAVENAVATVRGLVDGVRTNLGAISLVPTLPVPADTLFGSFDRQVSGTQRAMIERFNEKLLAELPGQGDMLVDVAHLAATIGLARWHDMRAWHSAKLPFGLEFTPIYCDHVCRVFAAMRGKSRKCLVLDLDNTLWGGIIGDDGLEGLQLGQGSTVGEAHVHIQQLALDLRDRGIVLAICSKNEEENARRPFREHAEMVLQEDHIAVFIANWNDKAGNLRDIAATLNIGTDALVFLDDNPAERAIVRRELPEVAVPEVGSDPSEYAAALAQGGWFEALGFVDEDRKRAAFYQANTQRQSAQGAVTNIEDYLRSLEMEAVFGPFDSLSRGRIAQLINKSNQFNLTTRRYTEADVARLEQAEDSFTVQVRLIDRFGDNGIISLAIFDREPECWNCDTWLMSCRVLGRRVEEAVLQHVAAAATAAGVFMLRGTYVPTKKNAMVERHFEKLGFIHVADRPEGGHVWELDLRRFVPSALPLRIR